MATKLTRTLAILVLLLAGPVLAQNGNKKYEEAIVKAQQQIEKNEAEKALQTAEKLAKEGSGEALLAASRIQAAAGKLEEAAATGTKALAAPGSPEIQARAYAHQANLDIQRGTGKDALANARKAVELQSNAETLAVLALAQAHVKDPQAVSTAEQAAKLAPANAVVQDALGHALAAAGKHAEAEAALAKAVELDPKLYRAHIHRAQLLAAAGKHAEAEAAARAATQLAPQQGLGFAVMAEAMLAKDPRNAANAINEAQQAAFLNPHSAYVQFTVGRIFEAMGNSAQAAAAFRKALEVDASHTPARVALVNAQFRAGNADAALVDAEKLATENPNDGEAQLLYGRLLAHKNKYVEALEPLERATQLLPRNADAFALLGSAYQINSQAAEAAEAFKQALELNPGNQEVRIRYAYNLGASKQTAAAIAEANKVIASGFKGPEPHWVLGHIHSTSEPRKPLEASVAFKKALEIDPKHAASALGLGRAQYALKHYPDALASLEKAVQLEPKLACDAAYTTVLIHYAATVEAKSKDLSKAKAALEKFQACVPAGHESVTRMRNAIAQAEKGFATEAPKPVEDEQPKGPDLGTVARALQGSDVGARRNAARQCVAFGAECVPYLLPLVNRDPDLGVKTAVAKALMAIGPAAKGACTPLQNEISASSERMVLPVQVAGKPPTAEQEAIRFGREQELQQAARAAIAKICK